MSTVEITPGQLPAPAGDMSEVERSYRLAKRAEWQVDELPWESLLPVPEARGGVASEGKTEMRARFWRSIIGQQLQADELAVKMAAQLLNAASHPEAKLYYSTMVQDESRHTEAWLRLTGIVGQAEERDPHLDELVRMVLEADSIEEKIFMMQVFFEAAIIPRFKMIEKSSRGTVLGELCVKLAKDDGIHHASGMAYERVLLRNAPEKIKKQVVETGVKALPHFAAHALWRPPARRVIGRLMEPADRQWVADEINRGIRQGAELGLDMSEVPAPHFGGQ
jgi:hypothetical protein